MPKTIAEAMRRPFVGGIKRGGVTLVATETDEWHAYIQDSLETIYLGLSERLAVKALLTGECPNRRKSCKSTENACKSKS